MKCSKCSQRVGHGVESCPACGTQINWEIIPPSENKLSKPQDEPVEPLSRKDVKCKHCSCGLVGSEKFCPNCGNIVVSKLGYGLDTESDLISQQHLEELPPRLPFIDRLVDSLGNYPSRTFINPATGTSSPNQGVAESDAEGFNFEKFSTHLKSDVKNEFVLSNLIIAGIGLLSTFLPYTDAYIRGSKIGLGLGVDGGFSAGGKIFLLISILFAGIGAIHFTDWIRDNENVTASTSGIFAVFLGVLGFIVLSAQSSSITSSMDNLGESAGLGVGVYFGYLDAVAMIGFGAVCFLNPRFFKDASSK